MHENRGGLQDRCSVGFESSQCKLGIHCEATIGVAMIAKTSEWEKADWIDLEIVIAYLLKRPINQVRLAVEHIDKYLTYREKMMAMLSKLADDFEPLFDHLISMFKDKEEIARWKPVLENYIKEDTQRRYGLK